MGDRLCRNCGAPIKFSRTAGGWLHAEPLANLRVSRGERYDVKADPIPPGHNTIHRQTVLHPAQPARRVL